MADRPSFSSPRTADLNNDGTNDVIQGFTNNFSLQNKASVVAINGETGELLWEVTSGVDYFSSPAFMLINNDNTPDVIIGGRGNIIAISGKNGEVLWNHETGGEEVEYGANVYSPQIISDQNNDGINDILTTIGGGGSNELERIPGKVLILSGLNGKLVAEHSLSDQSETYMSPLILRDQDELLIVYGSGGSTLPGSLWLGPLESLMNGSLGIDEEELYHGTNKGVIAPTIAVDINDDCYKDLIIQSFNDADIVAIDGLTHDQIWKISNIGYETYNSPTIGYFIGEDDTPDIFALIQKGEYPAYDEADGLIIDGKTGEVNWRFSLGEATFPSVGAISVDLNEDGRDEIILGVTDLAEQKFKLKVIDPRNKSIVTWKEFTPGAFNFPSPPLPLVADINKNGKLELLIPITYGTSATLSLYELPINTPPFISWGAYLGTHGNLTDTDHLMLTQ